MESWAQWVNSNTFIATALTSPYSEPTGTDFSSYFYLLDPNGDTLASDGVDFSTFRFQPLGVGGLYEDDYRFSPSTEDCQIYIYNYQDATGHVFTSVGENDAYIRLIGAMEGIKQTALAVVAGGLAFSYLF